MVLIKRSAGFHKDQEGVGEGREGGIKNKSSRYWSSRLKDKRAGNLSATGLLMRGTS